ncbi:MAG TPA: aldose epimerase [Coleofasciculaceae cyanobacterium]
MFDDDLSPLCLLMPSIATEQQQYKTYILTDAASRLEVVPERGGIITRWQVGDRELLYLDAERFANPELSVRGGIPILFPICGNLPNNTYTHQGQLYTLRQHGFARELPWEVVDESTQAGVSITLVLNSSDRTLPHYPFDFQLSFTYRLQGNSLILQQRYTNRSAEVMPFSTGLHPYFQVSDKSQLQFEIPATEFLNQVDQTVHPFAGSFDLSWDEIDVAFRKVTRQTASVTDPSQSLKLTLDYDPIYATLVFWTVKGKDYYCLEPWTAPRNALNTGENLTHLEPGATLETTVTLTASF